MTTFASLRPGLQPLALFDAFLQVNVNGQLPLAALAGNLGSSQRQWRSALVAAGLLLNVHNAVPADPTDPVYIQWNCGLLVETGDALWTFTQTTLGYTNAQMTALLTAAQALPF